MLTKLQYHIQMFLLDPVVLTKLREPKSKGTASKAGVSVVNDLNQYFTDAIAYAGYIVVALGIISLILAFAEQSMNSKAKGSMLVAGGAIMISFAAIMDNFEIGTDSTGKSITTKSLGFIGTGMSLVGAILLAFSVIQYIMAFIHSTPDENANASKGLAVGVAFSCGSAITKGLTKILVGKNHSTSRIVRYVVYEVIAKAATYAGAGLLIYGVVTYLLAYRDENAEGKMKSSICFAVGIGLASAPTIIKQITGLAEFK